MKKKTLLCLLGISFVLICPNCPLRAQEAGGRQNRLQRDPKAPLAGGKIFATLCQSCHGNRGGGGRAPAMRNQNFKHGSTDSQLFDSIQNGIPGTEMPASGLKQNEIWQVITYIRQLTGAYQERVPGVPAAGRKVLAGKGDCLKCHEVNGEGSRLGPDLSTIGSWSVAELRKALLQPGTSEGYQSDLVSIQTKDGRTLRGIRRNEDTFSLQLMDDGENLLAFSKADLAEVKHEQQSLMPEYSARLSSIELRDVIAYLKS